MAEDESIDQLCRRVRALGRGDMAEVGQLPAAVHVHWLELQSVEIVVTGPQWAPILARHPEVDSLLVELIGAVRAPDEIYIDSEHVDSATFWKRLD